MVVATIVEFLICEILLPDFVCTFDAHHPAKFSQILQSVAQILLFFDFLKWCLLPFGFSKSAKIYWLMFIGPTCITVPTLVKLVNPLR